MKSMKRRRTVAILMIFTVSTLSTTSAKAALLAEYTFDSDARDSAGFAAGLDGILGGDAHIANGVLNLDGDGDFMEIPQTAFSSLNPFDGTSDFSIQLTFKADPGSKGGVLISSARNNDIANHSMSIYLDGRGFEQGVRGGVVYDNFFRGGFTSSPPDLRDGVAHDLVLNYDAEATRFEMLVDGALRGGKIFDPSIPNIDMDTVRIGDSLNTEFPSFVFSPTDEFLGTIDNVRIFNSAPVAKPIRILKPRMVFLSGQDAPGTNSTFSSSSIEFVINDSGEVSFSTFTSEPAPVPRGLWTETSEGLKLVALDNTQAAGLPENVVFSKEDVSGGSQFSAIRTNNAGQIVFNAFVRGPGVVLRSDAGIWSGVPGDLRLVAREGDQAPGVEPGLNFLSRNPSQGLPRSFLNDAGQVAFEGRLFDGTGLPENSQGIWIDTGGVVQLAVRLGDELPEIAPDVVLTENSDIALPSALNDVGQLAFAASLSGPGINVSDNQAIVRWDAGNFQIVARKGDQAPGVAAGVNYSRMRNPAINNAGVVAFQADLVGVGVDNTSDSGIWTGTPGDVELVIQEGGQAPGTDPGVVFTALSSTPVINADGLTAFLGRIGGPGVTDVNNFGLWSEKNDVLGLVAREGDIAPGTTGRFFGDGFKGVMINALGQTAFSNFVDFDTHKQGIWVQDRNGELRLVAMDGQSLEVAPGDVRIISSLLGLGATGNEDGRPSVFTDSGLLVFRAVFTDGTSGLFVSNVATIPEPSTLTLLGLSLAGLGGWSLLRRRRGRRTTA